MNAPDTNDDATNDDGTNDPATNNPATNDPATNDPETESPNHKRTLLIAGGVVLAVIVLAGAGFAWWFLRDDAPDEVAIDSAAAQVSGDDSSDTNGSGIDNTPTTIGGSDATDTDAAGIDGTWTVDTTIGEFSYEDSTGTFVGFRIAEELQGIGSTEAVGRTPEVRGSLTADATTITEVAIEADMGAITTNESRRDDNVWDALDTDQFPTATFVLTEPIELGDGALAGEVVTIDAVGELTIHGVTRSVTFPLEAQLVDDTIVVVGSLDVVFADYDVEVPSAPVVISVEDHGPIELQLFFTR